MTVIEAVKKYGLEKSDKFYKDQHGMTHNLDIPLDKLKDMTVKSLTIYPALNETEITIII